MGKVPYSVDPARSALMSRVRARDTKPELAVRWALHTAGLRYRLHKKELPGSPDLVFPARRIVVFVHGCFWHCHAGCHGARMPKSHQDFWRPKLARNVTRDAEAVEALRKQGWTSLIIWECETRRPECLDALAAAVKHRMPMDRKDLRRLSTHH